MRCSSMEVPQKAGALAALHTTLKQYGTQMVDKSSSFLSSSGKFWNTLCRCPHGIKSPLAHSSDLYFLSFFIGFSFFLVLFSCFSFLLPGITSQVNHIDQNSCLRLCFQRNPYYRHPLCGIHIIANIWVQINHMVRGIWFLPQSLSSFILNSHFVILI